MIAWMQKHNKYLVITIWIATIAFIGAGFVGWGSYQFSSKASTIAEVGDVEISQAKFSFVYGNIYNDFANRMKGNFDDKKAKELGIQKMAYRELLNQSLLLNLANKYGVVVSDEELAKEIKSIPAFMKDGKFNKQIYSIFLRNRGLKISTFENIVRDDLRVAKLMDLLSKASTKYERSVINSIIGLRDKIEFTILNINDINYTVKESELKKFFDENRDRYKTDRSYKVALSWSDTENIKVPEDELKKFYQKNSFNYTDSEGRELEFEKIKADVERDYKLKIGKRDALLERIALKKGKKEFQKELEVSENDPIFTKDLWKSIVGAEINSTLKPKPVGSKYAIVKLLKVQEPRLKSFEEAKKSGLIEDFLTVKKRELLTLKAKKVMDSNGSLDYESGFIGIKDYLDIPKLNPQEKKILVQELFSSYGKSSIVDLGEKKVVYKILKQKLDINSSVDSSIIRQFTDNLKDMDFQNQLIKSLSSQYPVKLFVKGL